jgi:hypothetical protein
MKRGMKSKQNFPYMTAAINKPTEKPLLLRAESDAAGDFTS